MSAAAPGRAAAVTWHDVECGAYTADLPLWRELAAVARGPVLDLGSGTGRVSIALAESGFEVTAVDRDDELLAELERRARDRGLEIETVRADVRSLPALRRFALALAPMQLVQLLGGPAGRRRLLEAVADRLERGGRLALAILADPAPSRAGEAPPVPDVLEVGGWVYSSLPVDVARDGDAIVVRRLRQRVSPGGELSEQLDTTRIEALGADELEDEARACGLRVAARRPILATDEHVGSTVVVCERS